MIDVTVPATDVTGVGWLAALGLCVAVVLALVVARDRRDRRQACVEVAIAVVITAVGTASAIALGVIVMTDATTRRSVQERLAAEGLVVADGQAMSADPERPSTVRDDTSGAVVRCYRVGWDDNVSPVSWGHPEEDRATTKKLTVMCKDRGDQGGYRPWSRGE